MAVSKRLRFEILKRDNHTCQYCGRCAPEVVLQIDHVVPAALGGSDLPVNLTTACRDCNSGKGSSQQDDRSVDAATLDAARWRRAVIEAGEIHRADKDREQGCRDKFERRWTYALPDGWGQTIDQFARLGLEPADIEYIAERAIEKATGQVHAWRYFCKVAWSNIHTARDAAARKLAQGDGVQELTCDVCRDTLDAELTDFYLHNENYLAAVDKVGRAELGTHCSAECADVDDSRRHAPPQPSPPRWAYCIECDDRLAHPPENPMMEDGLCLTCRRLHYEGTA